MGKPNLKNHIIPLTCRNIQFEISDSLQGRRITARVLHPFVVEIATLPTLESARKIVDELSYLMSNGNVELFISGTLKGE